MRRLRQIILPSRYNNNNPANNANTNNASPEAFADANNHNVDATTANAIATPNFDLLLSSLPRPKRLLSMRNRSAWNDFFRRFNFVIAAHRRSLVEAGRQRQAFLLSLSPASLPSTKGNCKGKASDTPSKGRRFRPLLLSPSRKDLYESGGGEGEGSVESSSKMSSSTSGSLDRVITSNFFFNPW